MEYRPEIDGLRAIAVCSVIFFHAGFQPFSGGYLGVDIFFVISGYLITSIIYKDICLNRFSLLNFYERRARRILPALFVVVGVSIPIAWLVLLPADMINFAQSIIAVTTYTSNFLFWLESGYFDQAAELKPLLHTWSLAVEEQFYILFPVVFFLLLRVGLLFTNVVIILLISISVYFANQLVKTDASLVFYLLPFRAWELLIGSVIALYLRNGAANISLPTRQFVSVMGFSAVIVSILIFSKGTPSPSYYTLLPVLGCALVIAFADKETWIGIFLSNGFLVQIGLLSYSAYLWHQPAFTYAKHLSLHELSYKVTIALCILTFILSYFSWKFVEQPFRSPKKTQRNKVFTYSLIFSIGLFCIGITILLFKGVPNRISEQALSIVEGGQDLNPDRWRCQSSPNDFLQPSDSCSLGSEELVVGVLVGDSHTDAIAPTLSVELLKLGVGIKHMWHNSCPPIIGVKRADVEYHRCAEYNTLAQTQILNDPSIKVVVMMAWWAQYYEGKTFRVDSNDYHGEYVESIQSNTKGLDRKGAIESLFFETVSKYVEQSKKVIIIYPVPEMYHDVPVYSAKKIEHDGDLREYTIPLIDFNIRTKGVVKMLDRVRDLDQVDIVIPSDFLCDSEVCYGTTNGRSLYRDSHHLTKFGAKEISYSIAKKVNESL